MEKLEGISKHFCNIFQCIYKAQIGASTSEKGVRSGKCQTLISPTSLTFCLHVSVLISYSALLLYDRPKVYRRVHFQNSPAPCTSRHILKQPSTENAAVPLPDQSKQVLPEIHNPLTSAATGATLPQSPVIEDHIHKKEVEEFSQAREDLKENTHRNMLDVEERHSSDNPQVYSESSSISESNFARTFEAQVGKFASCLFLWLLTRTF